LQDRFGYIDREAVPLIADALNLSRAEVHGVVTFYHDFRESPPGRQVVRICRAEACQSMGGERLAAHVKERLGIDFHETSADGWYTLEPVFCLGDCACSPAVMVDGKLHGRVDPATFDRLIADRKAGR
jgi:formate dehydrogenase subunit gamma